MYQSVSKYFLTHNSTEVQLIKNIPTKIEFLVLLKPVFLGMHDHLFRSSVKRFSLLDVF